MESGGLESLMMRWRREGRDWSKSIRSESDSGINRIDNVLRWNDDRETNPSMFCLGHGHLYLFLASMNREVNEGHVHEAKAISARLV